VRMAPDEHVFVIVEHHFVHDGWSFGIFLREMRALYLACAAGRESPLPEPAVQFADYAVWQREWMQTDVAQAKLRFWEAELAGVPPLALPTDLPRPARMRFRGARDRIHLPPALAAAARAFSREHGATFFMTLMTAFQALMGRYSGQRDFCVGSHLGNRGQVALEDVIGMVVNMVGIRADLSGDPTALELLRQVQATMLRAYEYQEVPFDQVVRRIQPERSASALPICQVSFAAHDAPQADLSFGGLSMDLEDVLDNGSAKFDLQVTVVPRLEQGITGREDEVMMVWEYDTDLFAPATVRRMIAHYETLLEALIADPHRRLSELPLLREDERRHVLEAWNATDAEYPGESCIHELFAARAARTPDATAVVFGDRSLTYSELNRRANRLAHHLRSLGVGPDARVAVCVERSAEMVVALLAVMKAGGAYVPLDPGHPAERLEYMLADSAPVAVLTQKHFRDQIENTGVPVLEIDADRPEWADHPATDPERGALTPAHLAYVIYTSGSTGRPKGVAVPHRGVVNLLRSMRETVGMEPADRVLAVTTYAFDISVLEIFLPLLHGARTIVLPRERSGDPATLAEAIRAYAPTVMQATPATWRMLVQAGWEGAPEMRALCGGEALPAELASALRSRVGALWNVYGPTETTIWSTAHPIRGASSGAVDPADPADPADSADSADSESGAGHVPVGRPVANTRVYVLDAAGQTVPVGVAGELYIGGVGVV
ncbi:MAG TPA: amino acid adenylation domain-containing protein, partial [Longimicrobium sp.]|nr:amino acid adenylation domain-containing protein [Longimicrobium sp.]